jgi:D-alanyl-lipoteichoic acid acyltransferase DltB (MBOAT superfamily)
MLFNSVPFIAVFLPITLAVCFLLAARVSARAALAWVAFASLVFYAYWRLQDVPVLIGSVCVNYLIGRSLQRRPSKPLLIAGIAANLLLLGYFKYLVFLTVTANAAFGGALSVPQIVLPLGISFYTFQQIAYLVDSHGGAAKEPNPLHYLFFISFFPQLIAGPIVHHKEIMPQLAQPRALQLRLDNLLIGVTIFAIGLAKKVLIADRIAPMADGPFDAAAAGGALSMLEAWAGALGYALQIYFDFSGYSDMAIGLARMVGIRLPVNFASPYKARSIVEFWSRWHVTLTRFLTAYIYNPLAVQATRRRAARGLPLLRKGAAEPGAFLTQLAMPAMTTMLLSGIWHGAGFQFVLWGALHGLYIAVNHAWRMLLRPRLPWRLPAAVANPASVGLTFLAVVLALVFFRAESVAHGWAVLSAMAGANGIVLPPAIAASLGAIDPYLKVTPGHMDFLDPNTAFVLGTLLAVVWVLPNTQEIMAWQGIAVSPGEEPRFTPMPQPDGTVRLSPAFALAVGALASIALLYTASAAPTRFIYFNF